MPVQGTYYRPSGISTKYYAQRWQRLAHPMVQEENRLQFQILVSFADSKIWINAEPQNCEPNMPQLAGMTC